MYIGVDGCTDGWISVWYDDSGYVGSELCEQIDEVWDQHGNLASSILVDIPIGLREGSNKKRPNDDAARQKLGQPRGRSVFAVPVRAAVHEDSYELAKETQEKLTTGSLGTQSWAISDKIAELDKFLRETKPDAIEIIREAHPEICFWALSGESATEYSKTQQPAAAFWERVGILKTIDSNIIDHIWDAAKGLDAEVGNDDLIDAFALALTASPLTGATETLPHEQPEGEAGDPTGKLQMEMVYTPPSE